MNSKLLNFGIINIDKPRGPTSFAVTEFVRSSLGLNKASHMGTLDPKVTGVLPITLGRACRLSDFFMRHDKTYVGVLHTHKESDMAKIQDIINRDFIGTIEQIPPHKSSVKRALRKRKVYFFNLLEKKGRNFLFECKVEGGTYIRKICSDLGEKIGGAHMAELRRTVAGIFDESTIKTLSEFENAVSEWKKGNDKPLKEMILPAEEALKMVMPEVELKSSSIKRLLTGKPLFKSDIVKIPNFEDGEFFAGFCNGQLIAVYRVSSEGKILARPKFVYN
ncbi:RNA-guided pseudouridylation complex pseudouridine synthase subunit Cbf5 [Candidatus Pacearchaeota archaeon]|nr:MAG: RNA-guided pseudouridylation complex pseudouridine synthase subunit Cbf5 [Candidatus Pacearchaeota archaeon]